MGERYIGTRRTIHRSFRENCYGYDERIIVTRVFFWFGVFRIVRIPSLFLLWKPSTCSYQNSMLRIGGSSHSLFGSSATWSVFRICKLSSGIVGSLPVFKLYNSLPFNDTSSTNKCIIVYRSFGNFSSTMSVASFCTLCIFWRILLLPKTLKRRVLLLVS